MAVLLPKTFNPLTLRSLSSLSINVKLLYHLDTVFKEIPKPLKAPRFALLPPGHL